MRNYNKYVNKVLEILFMLIATIGIGYAETPDTYTEGYYAIPSSISYLGMGTFVETIS